MSSDHDALRDAPARGLPALVRACRFHALVCFTLVPYMSAGMRLGMFFQSRHEDLAEMGKINFVRRKAIAASICMRSLSLFRPERMVLFYAPGDRIRLGDARRLPGI